MLVVGGVVILESGSSPPSSNTRLAGMESKEYFSEVLPGVVPLYTLIPTAPAGIRSVKSISTLPESLPPVMVVLTSTPVVSPTELTAVTT
ncbi:hypothetical protein D3C81_1692070 [compost metagenome]